jgi:hypothetical protein
MKNLPCLMILMPLFIWSVIWSGEQEALLPKSYPLRRSFPFSGVPGPLVQQLDEYHRDKAEKESQRAKRRRKNKNYRAKKRKQREAALQAQNLERVFSPVAQPVVVVPPLLRRLQITPRSPIPIQVSPPSPAPSVESQEPAVHDYMDDEPMSPEWANASQEDKDMTRSQILQRSAIEGLLLNQDQRSALPYFRLMREQLKKHKEGEDKP